MSMRPAVAAVLLIIACVSLDIAADADTWLTWDTPASQAQDAMTDQECIYSDVEGEVGAILPLHDDGKRHVRDSALGGSRTACAAGLTRSPPSA